MLIFSTGNNLQLLSAANTWYADGTFSIVPPLFTQLYTIHADCMGQCHPLIYALLPNKQERSYDLLLDEVKNLIPRANPQSVSTDFEKAAINSFESRFPNVQVLGCFFHFSQNVYKKISENGLQVRYRNDANFALSARMIPALAFVPLQDQDVYFNDLSVHLDPVLQPVLDYVEDTYFGRFQRRGNVRRPCMFPPPIWNVYDRTVSGMGRTNNAVEA